MIVISGGIWQLLNDPKAFFLSSAELEPREKPRIAAVATAVVSLRDR